MENGERGEPRGIVKTERRIWAVTSAQQREYYAFSLDKTGPEKMSCVSPSGEYEEMELRRQTPITSILGVRVVIF